MLQAGPVAPPHLQPGHLPVLLWRARLSRAGLRPHATGVRGRPRTRHGLRLRHRHALGGGARGHDGTHHLSVHRRHGGGTAGKNV